jgi:hypothetical protein
MPRYFFNMDDGRTAIDNEGSDLPDLKAAQEEALVTTADMMRGGGGPDLWSGKPWRMWVTDQPGGAGKTFFSLRFSATEDDGQP